MKKTTRRKTAGRTPKQATPSATARPPRTLAEVAKALRLDASTISLVLSGSPRISDKTRKRVLDYCDKVHFQPNLLARALSRGRSGLLGVLVPSVDTSFFPQIVEGIEEVVNGLGMTSLLGVSNYEPQLLCKQLQAMRANRVEGLLIAPTGRGGERELLRPFLSHVPVVWFIHALEGDPPENCVRIDNELGAYLGTRHLLEHGHRRVAFLAGPPPEVDIVGAYAAARRFEGYRRALTEHGIAPDPRLVAGFDFTHHSGHQAAQQLLRLADRPTAFMASSDYAALGAIEYFLEQGLRPGTDVAIIGFDGLCCAANCPIPLTTVNQPKRELGIVVAQTLAAMLDGTKPPIPVLEPTLVIQRTCGCTAPRRPGS